MAESILRDKAKEFAKQIVFLCRDIKANMKESVLTNQLLRSGTSIGANIREAKYAHSKSDFISKLQISLKECYETEYWLEILQKSKIVSSDIIKPLAHDCGVIRRMLVSSLNTAKGNNSN